MKRKPTIVLSIVTALILSVPLVAMQFSKEVNWSLMDFVVAAMLIMGSGLAIDFTARRSRNITFKLGVVGTVGTCLFLTWINLAVGIIGNEDNPANLMYSTVILICIVGVIGSGFQPRGMSYALFATAIAQFLVPVIAFFIWHPPLDDGLIKTFVLNTNIAVLFVGSGILFRRASVTSPDDSTIPCTPK